MIDLYTDSTPNGWRASVMLEEIGMEYTTHHVDIMSGAQKEEWFVKLCPNGRIPVIVDRDNDGLAIFESGAIMLYLAKKSGQLMPQDDKDESRVTQWLMFQMAGIGPMMGQSNVFYRYFREKLPSVIQRFHYECRRLYEVLDGQLAGRDYLCDDYSIADIAKISRLGWNGSKRARPASVVSPYLMPRISQSSKRISKKTTAVCALW